MEHPLPRKPRVVAPRAREQPSHRAESAPEIPRNEGAPVSFAIGGDRPSTRALLEAHLVYERRRRARFQTVVALAVSSILPWISMLRPSLVPPPVRAPAFAAWAGLLVLTGAAALSEARWYRRMIRRANELGGGVPQKTNRIPPVKTGWLSERSQLVAEWKLDTKNFVTSTKR